MTKRIPRMIDAFSILALAWAFLAILPVEALWYRPGTPVVADTTAGKVPGVAFERKILRNVRMSYSVVIRSLDDMRPICDPRQGPFTYRKDATPPDAPDLVWWTGADPRCWPQEPGSYLMETCWTVAAPFGGVVPPKTTCRQSPPFRVSEG